MRDELLESLLKYVKIDTKSDPNNKTLPSTPGQMDLAKIIKKDWEDAGVEEIELTNDCYLFGTIPSNVPKNHPTCNKIPVIGLCAHFDTSEAASGTNVKPRIIENYKGEKVLYPNNPDLYLDTDYDPELKNCIGHTIITSDGTTLLGGDDKAGLSIMLAIAKHLKEHPEIIHGKIRLCGFPDEENARGSEDLDTKKFAVDIAYALDGLSMGQLDIECFSGKNANIVVEGVNANPGYGKNKLVSAIDVISKFNTLIPKKYWSFNVDGKEPYMLINSVEGDFTGMKSKIALRSFDKKGMEEMEEVLHKNREEVLKEFPGAKIKLDIKEYFKNYGDFLKEDPRVVDYAVEGLKRAGVKPILGAVRGGCDSCQLADKGIKSLNYFIGMQQPHSEREWISLQVIEKSFESLVETLKVWVEKSS